MVGNLLLALSARGHGGSRRLDTSFMLYMNMRRRTITRTLYDMAQERRKLKEGLPQLAKGHSDHRPFVRHEGEDEDGLPGKPPEKGHEV